MGKKLLITESDLVNLIKEFMLLHEEIIQGSGGDQWKYKKNGDRYFVAKKGSNSWKEVSGEAKLSVAKKFGSTPIESKNEMSVMAQKYKRDPYFLYLDGKKQKLYLFEKGNLTKKYDVSTGAAGFGNEPNTGKTPKGLITIKKKVGSGLPDSTLLVNLRPVKKKNGEYLTLPTCDSFTDRIFRGLKRIKQYIIPGDLSDEDEAYMKCEAHVLTRALVLIPSRGIYIHGTNRENHLGQPLSSGCIRMSNSDVKDLYNKVGVGTKIYIQP